MEIWKDIVGYNGDYKVSDLGRVKSLKFNKEKILKTHKDKGYLIVGLSKKGKNKTFRIHQLVAIVFLKHTPNGYNGLIVDHLDNNPLNNKLDNLQLTTARNNSSKDRIGSSKYTGVSWCERYKKWRSRIYLKGKHKHLGRFTTELEAHKVYQKELKKL